MHTTSPSLPRLPLVRGALTSLLLLLASRADAQMLDDGLLIKRRELRTSVEFSRDQWNEYWEGGLRRTNENIGTLTTQALTVGAIYGLGDRINLFATLPYVWTRASEGVLHEMQGRQDLTLAAKLGLARHTTGTGTTVNVTALAGVATPASDYTPDFQPLSIGLGSRRALVRGAFHAQAPNGVFVDGSAAYTWRSTVHLDRAAYYTDGQLVQSDEVAMPDVFDYVTSVGIQRGRLCLPIMLVTQRTRGGGDIRRQDMPFVSNRMDFTRLGARAMYTLPRARGLILDLGASRTLTGRNVGRSTMVSVGLTSVLHP